MRHYYIYLIKAEIARHYFGMEEKLYRLFDEFWTASDENMKDILNRQVSYVSHALDKEKIGQYISSVCKSFDEYSHSQSLHLLENDSQSSKAKIELHDRFIQLVGEGTADQEITFFEILRRLDSHFLAVDFDRETCAWLSPIKNADFLRGKVDLISRDSVH